MNFKNGFKETERGFIPTDWDYINLGKFCHFQTGKLNSNMEEENGDFPFFTCSPDTLSINSYSFDCEAILLAGNNAEGKFNVKYYNGKFEAYQRTYIITIKDLMKLDYSYLYFCLILSLDRLKESSQGTATKFLTMKILNSLEIPVPSINEQRKIGQILLSLDKKIQSNCNINQSLERMGQAIFKQWFVNFEFPDEKYRHYKSNGGEMVDSELGEIPKDWITLTLGDVCSSISETYNLKNKDKINFLNTGDVFDGNVIRKQISEVKNLPGQAKKKICKNDILFSEIRPANRHFAFIDFDAKEYVVSTKFMVLRANNRIIPELLYQFLKLPSTLNYFQKLAESRSGTFPQITFETVKHVQITLPNNRNQLNNLGSIFSSILEMNNRNIVQNNILSEIRDSLLSKLISGNIRVNMGEIAK